MKDRSNKLSAIIVGAAIEVHRELGPGLLESAYEAALATELSMRGVSFAGQVELPVLYKGYSLEAGYRLDFLIDKLVILELKSVAEVAPIHRAQLLTYLRLSKRWLGLILNFNVPLMKNGIVRIANG